MILKIFLFWRIGLLFVTYLGSKAFPLAANKGLGAISLGKNFNYWMSWAQWDGGHYFNIAKYGYSRAQDYAFFPLYPFLIKILSFLTFKNYLVSGLIISNIAFLLFLIFFFRLIEKKYGKKTAFSSLVTFLVFPTTFFTVAFYSESIFLLLVVLFFWALSKKKYLLSGLFVSLASISRSLGIFLIISFLYSYFSQIKFNLLRIDRRFFWVLLAFLGFGAYSFYLFLNFHDPLLFLSAQKYWEREVIDPASTIFSYLWAFFTGLGRPINDYFDLSLTILFLAILIFGARKISSSWWIFSCLAILIPASTGTLTSMPRYLLASLGSFVIMGRFLEERKNLRILVWSLSLFTQSILAVFFISGYWVA